MKAISKLVSEMDEIMKILVISCMRKLDSIRTS